MSKLLGVKQVHIYFLQSSEGLSMMFKQFKTMPPNIKFNHMGCDIIQAYKNALDIVKMHCQFTLM